MASTNVSRSTDEKEEDEYHVLMIPNEDKTVVNLNVIKLTKVEATHYYSKTSMFGKNVYDKWKSAHSRKKLHVHVLGPIHEITPEEILSALSPFKEEPIMKEFLKEKGHYWFTVNDYRANAWGKGKTVKNVITKGAAVSETYEYL